MQIQILNGIYTDNGPDLRTSYPVNMVPVPKQSGISAGFLRPGDGIVANGTGPGTDRGGINWNGICYRVMGTKLVTVSSNGAVTVLGDVGGPVNTLVTMDYSFDRLAIASGGRLYYWSSSLGLVQVTDPDLGVVLDVVWVDGYFMTTDGEFLIVTELTDPTQVNPLKYGSSEVDPDPVVALLKLRNEIYALNRNTIEVFDNVGGEVFPFARIDGAQIQKGVVGTFACCTYIDRIAFMGSGRNEAPGIYVGAAATTQKISTQEIDELLLTYTEAQLATVKLEARNDKAHEHLYVHLPDKTLVYDAAASAEMQTQVWFTLTTSTVGFSQYRARNLVWAYDKWLVGDPQSSAIGYLVDNIGTHWGQIVRWEFGTIIVYNEGNGAIFNKLELVSLTGRVALGIDPIITTSYSVDGMAWSQDRPLRVGTTGSTTKRLAWFQQGHMRNWRIQRFRGDSQAHLSFARLEAQLEPLAY
ncbi:Bacteriophage P22, Gp10, DNA-stabilising [uncultured Caudovirales phage]|uniref:Bacteriophage P22, Gp10, DNA-stabilising n=1 Tax=uncultured Caudovirales phage TaxID=2100421 RepID=A0A6J5P038_9CAUD|nr:Bacteriophage P22, Gp10, DNA-stabilising [uncultured Caudovirales phage]CAB4160854.1 Bacteriophage P22, Gp10, DNA-stabilising [uncultured Caudovirales phage]